MKGYSEYIRYDRQNPKENTIEFGQELNIISSEFLIDQIIETSDLKKFRFSKENFKSENNKDPENRFLCEIDLYYTHSVLHFKNFQVFLPSGGVLINNKIPYLLEDSLYMSLLHFHPEFRNDKSTKWKWRYKNQTEFKSVSLISLGWCYHRFYFQYFHWFIDCLPRLWILLKYGIKPEKYFFGEIGTHEFIIESLKVLNISLDSCIQIDLSKSYNFSNVYFPTSLLNESVHLRPSLGDGKHFKGGWDPDYLKFINKAFRNFYLKDQNKSTKRIFITRGELDHRKLENKKEIYSLLEKFNFEIINPGELSFSSQVKTFASASIIIGIHGAGLTNVLWANTSSKVTVIEIFVSGLGDPGYKMICKGLDLNYLLVAGKPNLESPKGIAYDNLYVNQLELQKAILKAIDLEN